MTWIGFVVTLALRRPRVAGRLAWAALLIAAAGTGAAGAWPLGPRAAGRAAFEWVVAAQTIAILIATPALVVDAIGGLRAGRPDLLLTTRLTAAEILAGRLLAALRPVFEGWLLAAPLITLIGAATGGVGPWLASLAIAGTLSTLAATAALSAVLVLLGPNGGGGATARVTTAILAGNLFAWPTTFIPGAPAAVRWLAKAAPSTLVAPSTIAAWGEGGTVRTVLGAIAPTTGRTTAQPERAADLLAGPVSQMIAAQAGFALICALIALCLVRGLGRPQGQFDRRRVRSRRGAGRPPPFARLDDPMLWKECRGTPSTRSVAGVAAILIGCLALLAGLGYAQAVEVKLDNALGEWGRYGYGVGPLGAGGLARDFLGQDCRWIGALIATIALLGLAAAVAAGIADERRCGTWDALAASPLTSAEIVRAKAIGAVSTLGFLAVLATLPWLAGLGIGAVHPLGLIFGLAGLAAAGWSTAAVGAWSSARGGTARTAMLRTLGTLAAVNIIPYVLMRALGVPGLAAAVGCTPLFLFELPISPLRMLRLKSMPAFGLAFALVVALNVAEHWLVARWLFRDAVRRLHRERSPRAEGFQPDADGGRPAAGAEVVAGGVGGDAVGGASPGVVLGAAAGLQLGQQGAGDVGGGEPR